MNVRRQSTTKLDENLALNSRQKTLPIGLFGRIQRKFSLPPAQTSRTGTNCLQRRKARKLSSVESFSSDEIEEEFQAKPEDHREAPQKSTTTAAFPNSKSSDFEREQMIAKVPAVTASTAKVHPDALHAEKHQDCQKKYGTLRPNGMEEFRETSRVAPVPEKENRNAFEKMNARCLERVRILMEQQSIKDMKPASDDLVPRETQRAFAIYNGRWKDDDIERGICIQSLLDCNDADQGEFYLFYKRIFHYILIRDSKANLHYKPNFLSRSKLSPSIRSTLFDWMIKVQQYLHMRTESLHMATTFVDHYTWRRKIAETNYQLVGITALFLAGKVNERLPPSLRTLCYLTEHYYNPAQVLEMEYAMLNEFMFDVHLPIPHHFLETGLLACDDIPEEVSIRVRLLSLFLFDLGLTEVELSAFSASTRCAAVLFLSRWILLNTRSVENTANTHAQICSSDESLLSNPSGYESPGESPITDPAQPLLWTPKLISLTGHANNAKLQCVTLIYASALEKAQRHFLSPSDSEQKPIHEAAFIKYSNKQYGRIAQLPELATFHYPIFLKEWQIQGTPK